MAWVQMTRGHVTRDSPWYDPGRGEDDQHGLAGAVVVGVAEELGHLEQGVAAVVHDHHEGPHPHEVGRPGEHDQGDGGLVVDEHLPEVFPLHIEELAEAQGPVERQLQHVVKPHIHRNLNVYLYHFEFCQVCC